MVHVMSEVKRYMEFCGEGGGVAEHADGGFVEFKDYDAQRLRADTAEVERDALKYDCQVSNSVINAQKADLAAAEQRISELKALLRRAREYGGLTPGWHDSVDAALNPECCKISAEDKALLDAGEYTPEELFGSGGKPSCPNCFNPNPEAESHGS